jgi:hypothetical protein
MHPAFLTHITGYTQIPGIALGLPGNLAPFHIVGRPAERSPIIMMTGTHLVALVHGLCRLSFHDYLPFVEESFHAIKTFKTSPHDVRAEACDVRRQVAKPSAETRAVDHLVGPDDDLVRKLGRF